MSTSTTHQRSGRSNEQLRPVTIETNTAEWADGSALISFGKTRVWCTASVEERVPSWMVGRGTGWVTAEYSMLPRATHTRSDRDRATNSPRSQEISRLIGRALRSGVDMKVLGERRITIDCNVLQADGGTRTAAITGGWVALALACQRLQRTGVLKRSPLRTRVAAISAGIVHGMPRLDLEYIEDRDADVDCNVVMNARGDLIEVQSTAEGLPLSREQLNVLLDLCAAGIVDLTTLQQQALDSTP